MRGLHVEIASKAQQYQSAKLKVVRNQRGGGSDPFEAS
jgi:hypothetical protein